MEATEVETSFLGGFGMKGLEDTFYPEENLVTLSRPLLATREGLQQLVNPTLSGTYDFDDMAKLTLRSESAPHPRITLSFALQECSSPEDPSLRRLVVWAPPDALAYVDALASVDAIVSRWSTIVSALCWGFAGSTSHLKVKIALSVLSEITYESLRDEGAGSSLVRPLFTSSGVVTPVKLAIPNDAAPYPSWRQQQRETDLLVFLCSCLTSKGARGLAYLHEDSNPHVIHHDFKANNVLLEDDFTPKVSDFRLAREATEGSSHIFTRVMGTFGLSFL
uniref:Receptor-like serine/threonine-protein kinase ALE2 isoform X2 n=1 Tax=Tanacetum cinerariifolium TaxID=118510 RepID=A0A6L2P1B8_TANCI|nr:receptor-like serine/threonine-protein kinase ALE2 isoform X2 [Tanacetum cinerariifolium]